MELPANPKNLLYGVYNNKGVRLDTQEAYQVHIAPWQLMDEEDSYVDDDTPDFGGMFS